MKAKKITVPQKIVRRRIKQSYDDYDWNEYLRRNNGIVRGRKVP